MNKLDYIILGVLVHRYQQRLQHPKAIESE